MFGSLMRVFVFSLVRYSKRRSRSPQSISVAYNNQSKQKVFPSIQSLVRKSFGALWWSWHTIWKAELLFVEGKLIFLSYLRDGQMKYEREIWISLRSLGRNFYEDSASQPHPKRHHPCFCSFQLVSKSSTCAQNTSQSPSSADKV